jgi:hypothetical protein
MLPPFLVDAEPNTQFQALFVEMVVVAAISRDVYQEEPLRSRWISRYRGETSAFLAPFGGRPWLPLPQLEDESGAEGVVATGVLAGFRRVAWAQPTAPSGRDAPVFDRAREWTFGAVEAAEARHELSPRFIEFYAEIASVAATARAMRGQRMHNTNVANRFLDRSVTFFNSFTHR